VSESRGDGLTAITGAAGLIGSILRRELTGELRLLDIRPAEGCAVVDLRDLAAVERAFDGVECVIHLGALSTEAPFDEILEHNIRATYNVFEAARRCGVRRVVSASTNHVIGMYPRSARLGVDVAVRPDTYYGVSKAFGEALGRLYAEKWGLEVACIRIGSVLERPTTVRHLSTWLSPRDAVALFRACLAAPLRFVIVYGVSRTSRGWWDMRPAQALGYTPVDDADAFADQVTTEPSDALGAQGGAFAEPGFKGA
jgi:uronate dehydrogenase